ncbi:uncharacterized protein LY79DRAFT_552439 [Colletotrichum navitas]|uniref:Uncharacterized protein n=1 Tax=Colletotrichum navitas TaxID=681940 RepID=A0AAD8PZZ6_9PEZI|nr:uncharacterized protein LY79DRAFT_552439 [Colletotrichum navitas]KAK1593311.1 hypothetical protein LY79DRAFT_552439 [Colletotrichum navitas]
MHTNGHNWKEINSQSPPPPSISFHSNKSNCLSFSSSPSFFSDDYCVQAGECRVPHGWFVPSLFILFFVFVLVISSPPFTPFFPFPRLVNLTYTTTDDLIERHQSAQGPASHRKFWSCMIKPSIYLLQSQKCRRAVEREMVTLYSLRPRLHMCNTHHLRGGR